MKARPAPEKNTRMLYKHIAGEILQEPVLVFDYDIAIIIRYNLSHGVPHTIIPSSAIFIQMRK